MCFDQIEGGQNQATGSTNPFDIDRGFFAGLSLDGSVLAVDDEANAAFYKNDELGPREILKSPGLKSPGAAAELRRVLEEYLDRLPAEKAPL